MSYSPTLGRWMEQDPAGYVDGTNLYQTEDSGPVDSSDPLGLWTTRGKWSMQQATVTAECGDNASHLAWAITGYESDAGALNVDEVQNGDVVDVTPLLRLLEDRLRTTIVADSASFAGGFGPGAAPSSVDGIDAEFADEYKQGAKPLPCEDAVLTVYAKAMIDTLGADRYSRLDYSTFGLPRVSRSVGNLGQLKPGDWIEFVNRSDYHKVNPGGAYGVEHAIYLGAGNAFANGVGNNVSLDDVVDKMVLNYKSNAGADQSVMDLGPNKGVQLSNVRFLDVAAIAQKSFEQNI